MAGVTVLLVIAALNPPVSPAEDASGYTPGGATSCLLCHDSASDHPADGILHSPHAAVMGQRQCEACHGPSVTHMVRGPDGVRPPPAVVFGSATPAPARNEACLGCHQDTARLHWSGNAHDFAEVSCSDCHTVHRARDPVLALETQPQVCFECHQRQRAEFLRPSRHPVQAAGLTSMTGALACTDCHNPHGSATPSSLARSTLNETCYDCHAEKRGPFLWEHAPVREDCSNCHTPHGSNHANLLVARAPWMCQQCHVAAQHPGNVFSGTGVPPAGMAQQVLARNCMNCHTQVHGSNHPSGVRQMR